MIRLRYSPSGPELELEGSRAELVSLMKGIILFCKSGAPSLDIPMDSGTDPAPYAQRLSTLRLVRTNDLLKLTVEGEGLAVAGKPESLALFAGNLPVTAEHPRHMNYHVHLDPEGMEGYLSKESLGIVLTLRRDPA